MEGLKGLTKQICCMVA